MIVGVLLSGSGRDSALDYLFNILVFFICFDIHSKFRINSYAFKMKILVRVSQYCMTEIGKFDMLQLWKGLNFDVSIISLEVTF